MFNLFGTPEERQKRKQQREEDARRSQELTEKLQTAAAKFLGKQLYNSLAEHHVLTVGSVSVAYRLNSLPLNDPQRIAAADQKLKEILTANQNADLKKFEEALGIEITAFEPKNKSDDANPKRILT